ncbi:MAG: ATP-binding protein, partial [Xanthomonadales bacterium]|nr:ATP-binding protein [Xanthomonadales bacterium]
SISLVRHGAIAETTRVDVAVGHLLQTLLNNAADAGEAAGVRRVDLKLEARDGMLHGEIRDYGAGLAEAQMLLPSRMFASGKSHGLGVGLALSHATVERLDGDLYARETEGPGICICFRLPLPAQEPA